MTLRSCIFLLFLFTSCGLRVTNYVDDNILVGSWQMNEVICYDINREFEIEIYALDSSTTTAQLDFGASDFSYSLSSSGCNTSAVGRYSTEFEGDSEDVMDMGSVTVSGESCEVDITDSGTNTVGTVSIDFDLFAPSALGLSWFIEELASGSTNLTLDLFTLFEGSSDGDGCGGQTCICTAVYSKI